MKRLTDRDGDMICKNEDCGVVEEYCPLCSNFCETLYHALRKLKAYEDAEEQGLLLRLREPLTDDLRKELDKYVK